MGLPCRAASPSSAPAGAAGVSAAPGAHRPASPALFPPRPLATLLLPRRLLFHPQHRGGACGVRASGCPAPRPAEDGRLPAASSPGQPGAPAAPPAAAGRSAGFAVPSVMSQFTRMPSVVTGLLLPGFEQIKARAAVLCAAGPRSGPRIPQQPAEGEEHCELCRAIRRIKLHPCLWCPLK